MTMKSNNEYPVRIYWDIKERIQNSMNTSSYMEVIAAVNVRVAVPVKTRGDCNLEALKMIGHMRRYDEEKED